MYDYTIVPNEKIQKRMDYFYMPYNQSFLLRKHMVFEEPEDPAANLNKTIHKRESTSGLEDINERMEKENKKA